MNKYFLRNSDVVNKYTTKPLLKMIRNASKYYFDGSDDAKIMKELNVSKKELERFKYMNNTSLNIDDDELKLHIASNYIDNPLDVLLSNETNDMILKIRKFLNTLDDRSNDIVSGRWLGDEKEHTLGYYAEKYGISKERVRQLEGNCIKRISGMVSTI
jgi:RNA polymerase sigma-32 factor